MHGGEYLDVHERGIATLLKLKHRLSWLLINVFAERLLLSMKQVDHPGTRAVISTLVFNVTEKEQQEAVCGSEFTEDVERSAGRSRSAEVLEGGGTEMKEMCSSTLHA